MDTFIAFALAHYQDALAIIGGVVLLASTVVKVTPTTQDDEILGKVIKVLDYFSIAYPKFDKKD